MTNCSFGDVVLVPFPFTDQTTTKQRPAVIVSSDEYQRQRPDVILMAVTSQRGPVAMVGKATIQHWRQAGLLKPLLATVEQRLIRRKLGALHPEDQRALRGSLDVILGR